MCVLFWHKVFAHAPGLFDRDLVKLLDIEMRRLNFLKCIEIHLDKSIYLYQNFD